MGQRVRLTSLARVRGVASHPAVTVAVTVLALAVFVHSVDLGAALRDLTHLDWRWALLGLGLSGLSVVASVMEWGALVRGAGKALGWRYLGGWYMKGLFINQVFPAGVGSDAIRALQVGKLAGRSPVLASLIGSRMAGTLAMALWGLTSAVVLDTVFRLPVLVGFACFSALMLVGWVLALEAERMLGRLLHRTVSRPGPMARLQRIRPLLSSLASYRGARRALTCSIVAGSLGWGLNLLAMQAFSRSLGYDISWEVFAVVLPLALLATFVPISANGIGIREGLLVLLLVQFHVPLGVATAMSIFVDLQMIPFAALGALVEAAEVALGHTYRRLRQVGSLAPGVSMAHSTLHLVVAPEVVVQLRRR